MNQSSSSEISRSVGFSVELLREVLSSVYTSVESNRDVDRFGERSTPPLRSRVKKRIESILLNSSRATGRVFLDHIDTEGLTRRVDELSAEMDGLSDVYDLLGDDSSRRLLVKLMAYRLLGNERVRLPLNENRYWERREYLRSLFDPDDSLPLEFNQWNLNKADLATTGYPIKLYSLPLGIQPIFDLKQYEYHNCNPAIKAETGDVVIDAGGCWGDTALYFANEVGVDGRVHTFEFMPANLNVMRKNLGLNPQLRERVTVVERPLWDKSDQTLYCKDDGPASRVSAETFDQDAMAISTISIDDFVGANSINRVDFIKMDIEGAELKALEGAATVISRCKPNLAISVYHRLSDFVSIPKFLSSLDLNYKFYLGHYTVHAEETVLFAAPQ